MLQSVPMALIAALTLATGFCQTPENVWVIVNQSSNVSRRIGEYYVRKRQAPLINLCFIKTTTDEEFHARFTKTKSSGLSPAI